MLLRLAVAVAAGVIGLIVALALNSHRASAAPRSTEPAAAHLVTKAVGSTLSTPTSNRTSSTSVPSMAAGAGSALGGPSTTPASPTSRSAVADPAPVSPPPSLAGPQPTANLPAARPTTVVTDVTSVSGVATAALPTAGTTTLATTVRALVPMLPATGGGSLIGTVSDTASHVLANPVGWLSTGGGGSILPPVGHLLAWPLGSPPGPVSAVTPGRLPSSGLSGLLTLQLTAGILGQSYPPPAGAPGSAGTPSPPRLLPSAGGLVPAPTVTQGAHPGASPGARARLAPGATGRRGPLPLPTLPPGFPIGPTTSGDSLLTSAAHASAFLAALALLIPLLRRRLRPSRGTPLPILLISALERPG